MEISIGGRPVNSRRQIVKLGAGHQKIIVAVGDVHTDQRRRIGYDRVVGPPLGEINERLLPKKQLSMAKSAAFT